jgi:hypothetical protein
MKAATPRPAKGASPSEQLRAFIAKFDPQHQALIRSLRAAMRRRLPAAYELVYDNYNFFVIGYGPTDRPSDAIFSITANASGLGLCFLHGARLPDPERVLQGSGRQTRFVRLASAATLKTPAVAALIDAAVQRGKPMPDRRRGQLIIRSVAANQRARRRPAKTGAA